MPANPVPANDGRRAELAAGLNSVRDRIKAACDAAGRDPAEITLIAITKTWPASDVRLLYGLGATDVGENRDAEAAPKAAACADLDLTWHFVGQLQTNKCRSVVRYASFVHSVDRNRLVTALGGVARAAGRVVTCLVQVSFDDDPGRGGVAPGGVPDLARAIDSEEGLRLGGVMAVAPLGKPVPAGVRGTSGMRDRRYGNKGRREGHLGRDERRSGGRGSSRRDTRANWYGVARQQKAPGHVMSERGASSIRGYA